MMTVTKTDSLDRSQQELKGTICVKRLQVVFHSWTCCWIVCHVSPDLLIITATESEQNLLIVSFGVILEDRQEELNHSVIWLSYYGHLIVVIRGHIFSYQDVLVERFAIVFLVLLLDPFHVDLRTGHHDAGQDGFFGPFSLMV